MAYISSQYQSQWQFDKAGNTLHDKMGNVIIGQSSNQKGNNENCTSQNINQLNKQNGERDKVQLMQERASCSNSIDYPKRKQTPQEPVATIDGREVPSNIAEKYKQLNRGYCWVSPKGEQLECNEQLQGSDFGSQRDQLSISQISDTQRRINSMNLWSNVNPGCMPHYQSLPNTTMQDHYQFNEAGMNLKKRHNLKKTDFTEYTEVSVRLMKQLNTNK